MQAEEIREFTDDELRARVGELEEERFRLRFRGATETLNEPLRVRVIRREVARLKTVLRERELGVARAAGTATESSKSGGGSAERAARSSGGRKS
jgi:large subunit ribosomal protein L29